MRAWYLLRFFVTPLNVGEELAEDLVVSSFLFLLGGMVLFVGGGVCGGCDSWCGGVWRCVTALARACLFNVY